MACRGRPGFLAPGSAPLPGRLRRGSRPSERFKYWKCHAALHALVAPGVARAGPSGRPAARLRRWDGIEGDPADLPERGAMPLTGREIERIDRPRGSFSIHSPKFWLFSWVSVSSCDAPFEIGLETAISGHSVLVGLMGFRYLPPRTGSGPTFPRFSIQEVRMATKKAPAKKKPLEMLLVQSKVKEYVRGQEMMCSSDLIESLNEEIGRLLDRAVQRAQDNGRKTARASDV